MTREKAKILSLFEELIASPLQTFPLVGETLNAPEQKGVYIIYSPSQRVLHVGRTPKGKKGLIQRLRNHLSGKNSSFATAHFGGDGSKLRGKHRYQCLVVKNDRERALLEHYAIGTLCPAHLGLSLGKNA